MASSDGTAAGGPSDTDSPGQGLASAAAAGRGIS